MRALLLTVALLLTPTLLAQSLRVDQKFGFRDLSFGKPLDTTQFTLKSRNNPAGIEQFIRNKENLRLGQATLAKITYITVGRKLARVGIESAPNRDDAYKLIAAAKESYGNPDKTLDAGTGTIIHSWNGNKATVLAFLYDTRTNQKADLFISDNAQKEYVSQHLNELDRTDEL